MVDHEVTTEFSQLQQINLYLCLSLCSNQWNNRLATSWGTLRL